MTAPASGSPFRDALERLLSMHGTPAVVRAVEAGEEAGNSRQAWVESGFADLLMPEASGGAGLSLRMADDLLRTCARHLLPWPLDATMIVRAALAATGIAAPDGFVAIAPQTSVDADGRMLCRGVPDGAAADWILATALDGAILVPVHEHRAEAVFRGGAVATDVFWHARPSGTVPAASSADWTAIGACLMATRMAGAMERLLEMTLAHTSARSQFGKPLAAFQAIQQQLAVMAEQVAAGRMAASIGMLAQGIEPDPLRAAVAKARTSEAVVAVTSIAHAVHGAIGIAAEFDLQLYTRRLHAWRLAFGTERRWHGVVGRALVQADAPVLDAIVLRTAPPAT
jgi:acyl-CoA dehydrogenase